MSLTSLPQNKETWLPQPSSPGLVFRLGVLIPQGLDTLLSHISEHRECGLHNEVDETCSEEGNTVAISSLEGWVVHMAGMAVTRLLVKQTNLGLQSSQWEQALGDILVTPANSPPSHSPCPWPSTSGPHTLAYHAGFYRKNDFEAWRLGVVLAQAQTASFPLPILSSLQERTLTNLGLCHKSGSAITQWRKGQAQLCLLVTLWEKTGWESWRGYLSLQDLGCGWGW